MKILQFGRSMIEMLGVLAIIGVLSIGGLLGYRRAVNNHQANTILDDANRLAFVVMENDRAFESNTFITDDLEFTQTSIYNIVAFVGTGAEEFGIVVTDVPKGVCESLVPKASVEYTVRAASAKLADNVQQLSAYGTLYDEQNTDICNDMNDVVLYFGDTSAQCDSTGEECTSYADCCHGSFCFFTQPSDTEGTGNGPGECRSIKSYEPKTTTMSDGQTWTCSKNFHLNWWSAMDWCEAQGKTPATRADVGPECLNEQTCSSSIMASIREKWPEIINYWLTDPGNDSGSGSYTMAISKNDNHIGSAYKFRTDWYRALCH